MKKASDFSVETPRRYPFQLGRKVASSLSGFVAGVIFASIVWVILFLYYKASIGAY